MAELNWVSVYYPSHRSAHKKIEYRSLRIFFYKLFYMAIAKPVCLIMLKGGIDENLSLWRQETTPRSFPNVLLEPLVPTPPSKTVGLRPWL